MSTGDKVIILAQVENKSKGKRQALMALGIPKSSYYRWWQGSSPSEEKPQGTEAAGLPVRLIEVINRDIFLKYDFRIIKKTSIITYCYVGFRRYNT